MSTTNTQDMAQDMAHDIASMLRVNHAGEYGAQAIYDGQLAVFSKSPRMAKMAQTTKKMARQEARHLGWFAEELHSRAARPSALMPVWRILGLGLGIGTALAGEKAAHACTEAVEDVIVEHYTSQLEALDKQTETRLRRMIAKARAEELDHKTIAVGAGARQAPAYGVLRSVIATGCRLAIATAKRV